MKVMFETATVTTRPPACGVADIFPAEPISDMIQPPKMSAGCGMAVRSNGDDAGYRPCLSHPVGGNLSGGSALLHQSSANAPAGNRSRISRSASDRKQMEMKRDLRVLAVVATLLLGCSAGD